MRVTAHKSSGVLPLTLTQVNFSENQLFLSDFAELLSDSGGSAVDNISDKVTTEASDKHSLETLCQVRQVETIIGKFQFKIYYYYQAWHKSRTDHLPHICSRIVNKGVFDISHDGIRITYLIETI